MQRCFESNHVAIKANIKPLEAATELTYLVRTITYNNIDWTEIYRNLRKSQRIWGMMEKVLRKMGELTKDQEMTYKMVVQAVLIHGRKVWVVTDEMITVLEGFTHRIARRVAGMTARK